MNSLGIYTLKTLCLLSLALTFSFSPAAAQEAVIEGTVIEGETGEPLPGANIIIEGTNYGAATNAEGLFRITVPSASVEGQTITVTARFVGYRATRQQITLSPGSHELDFVLREDVLGLEEVVVTGVVGATFKERLPFTVDLISRRDVEQVPYVSVEQSIRGKVPGARIVKGTGQPGTSASVMLRGATRIAHGNEPLYIIDGVILDASTVDIDGLDIETIEVVKGAAAASLYGSRAANGVIQIATRRGSDLAVDQTRITLRNEFGINQLPDKELRSISHHYLVDENNQYIDPDGNRIEDPFRTGERYLDYTYSPADPERGKRGVAFVVNPYPRTFDHIDLFFDPGYFYMNSISVGQRTANTNFFVSLNNLRESGIVLHHEGFSRQTIRLNLDHQINHNLKLSASGAYSRANRDDLEYFTFRALQFMSPEADLTESNPDGEPYLIEPHPLSGVDNPLYSLYHYDSDLKRTRTMGSFNLTFTPYRWWELEANFSYDRSNRESKEFYPKGFKTSTPSDLNLGRLTLGLGVNEAINSSITSSMNYEFGKLAARSQFRYLVELSEYSTFSSSGANPVVSGVPRLDLYRDGQRIRSREEDIRAVGFYFITGFDYDGRYIVDMLVRRDGSSLFGADERWHTYYRVSGAYRIAQENWWPYQNINEFKLRYSLGTAGGRPRFASQYETFAVSEGRLTKSTLGNRRLKPEFSIEQEAGIEIGLLDRFLLDITYAHTETRDQILQVPLTPVYGYDSQWQNAGTLESRTWEASLRAFIIQQRNFNWSATVLFDRTRSEITEFDRTPFRWGPYNSFFNREGEEFGAMYGWKWMTRYDQLPGELEPYRDYFDINDDGYLVPVGQNYSWQDGIREQMWGTEVNITDAEGNVIETFPWGHPILYVDEDGNDFHKIGSVIPDFNLSFSSNLRYKNITLYALFDAQIGGNIYNMTRQWAMRDFRSVEVEQTNKPREQWKPIQYYETVYQVRSPNNHFVEDGTFMKLRELSVRYTFDQSFLRPIFGGWINRLTVGFIGRNLLTFTSYSGFDPEVGEQDATVVRMDSFTYPNYRTFTGLIEIEF